MRDLNLTVSGFFSSSTGEAMLSLPQEERDRTAILIDVGYLCTDVMAVEGDAVIFQKTLPVGGGHIAADVSEGLGIPLEAAEQIKRDYVYGISTISQSYTVSGGDGVKSETFTQDQVAAVLEPRVDEIADMIREVTASRVIGGRVTSATTASYFQGTSASAVEHYFRVENMAAVLSCAVALDPDSGVEIVRITVDGNAVPRAVWQSGAFDALPYLSRDDLGVVRTGRHTLAVFPDNGGVASTVTVKGIEKS
jgi:hypothetical protein